jgi:methionine sulfoxide reductase heme-binding subunit
MKKQFEGWRIVSILAFALSAMAVLLLTSLGWGTNGYRMVIRATARTSLALFLAAFLASAMVAFWPNTFTRWLVRNRRYCGLSFAMSHGIHLAAIVALASTDPAIFWTLTNKASVISGSTGYLAIATLTATSFDKMVAWLGPKLWQRLHSFGAWFIWISFVFTNAKRVPISGWYALPVIILFAALVLKLAARRRKSQGTSTVSIASGSISGKSSV